MSEEKARVSGEVPSATARSSPILPVANEPEKPKGPQVPAALYIM